MLVHWILAGSCCLLGLGCAPSVATDGGTTESEQSTASSTEGTSSTPTTNSTSPSETSATTLDATSDSTTSTSSGPVTTTGNDTTAGTEEGSGTAASTGGVGLPDYGPCDDTGICPEGVPCHVDQFPNPNGGICAPPCEGILECTQVPGAVVDCIGLGGEGNTYCVIVCENEDNCPEGTYCDMASGTCLWPAP